MKLLRLAPVLSITLLLAACAAGATAHPASPVASVTPIPRITEPSRQLGIDIDFYAYSGMRVAQVAQQDIAYVKSLDANAVSISFPVFSNPPGSTVTATDRTPTTAQLGQVIIAAERAGLAVMLRPLLDEKSIGETRVFWTPRNVTKWFAAYLRFLIPYATLAQRDHVAVFTVGVELTKFGAVPQWDTLDSALRAIYHGTLAYSNNWTTSEHATPGNGGRGVIEMTDAYPPLALSDNATPTAVITAWSRWARPLPKGTVLSEVGIAALPGAYSHPYRSGPASTPLTPQIQANWFNAACRTVAIDNLGGLYFWSLNFGQSLTTPGGSSDPGSFTDSPGAIAIAKCFTSLRTAV
ncbi:MAG TPA: hypothetical protein VHO07_06705 [Streptosporangiaceae bacterium]|nr:hypothetical protein [Streptosporangiaceae bacterium]